MSERLTLRCYKGSSEPRFRNVFTQQVEQCGGEVHWGVADRTPREDLRTAHKDSVHTVYLPYLGGADYLLCRLVGSALGTPWLEARIQEGALWDYSLYLGGAHVDQFSTLPEYWDEDDDTGLERNRGDPDLLAELWQLPKERLERYIRQWGVDAKGESTFRARLHGKAYASDKHNYGNIYQMFDFLAALGALDPMAHGTSHRIIMPPIEKLQKAAERV